jgi:hypothetical protein
MTILLGAAIGCAPASTSMEPAPRPSPASGGFQAQQPRAEAWVPLGDPVEVTELQQTIYVSGHGGNIGQLLIQGMTGEPEIAQIQVEFMDDAMKRVDLQKRFRPGDGQVIELRDDRPIKRIIVFIDPSSSGTYKIFGA